MASNKANLQVGLTFSANTEQARREIQALQKELNSLATSTNLKSQEFGLGEASKAAAELAANLQMATNVETGRLDLTKFQQGLNQSGKSIDQYGKILRSLGPDGEKAFNNLTNAIMQAEVPLTRANKLISNLWTSFKQTAKYQFTASIYRGLISGLRNAYSYSQELNESLNNIRIVTGQSTEQMAKFAEQANKAARSLSTTTTDYTNAALIYYQQGLNDQEVKARTDVTMKLANASGVTAETASQQLTAIWNNFAKGSKNLEYFADVMTALGASTASSTSEIAEGLEKFAAIGETVGLSYEYAASALATVTATTRQSADVVGTAFKTLFARIQDLEVGETLEDGTTLGKYSQALATVGVNIKNANGELKAMDQILEEMAAAWNTISKDQQVALAQTVAGTRQYTQLVALMENWSFMQKNLQTSYDSSGTLQKQQEIYAESWEAAQKRVTAAAQGIYNSLLDDEFFIKLTNGFGNILQFLGDTIKGIGGLKSVLPMTISLFTGLFSDKIASEIDRINSRIRDTIGLTQKQALSLKTQALNARVGDLSVKNPENAAEISGNSLAELKKKEQQIQQSLLEQSGKLNEFELKRKQIQLDQIHNLVKEVELNDERLMQMKKETDALEAQSNIIRRYTRKDERQEFIAANNYSTTKLNEYKQEETQSNKNNLKAQAQLIISDERSTQDMINKAQKLLELVDKNRGSWKNVVKTVDELNESLKQANVEVEKLNGVQLNNLWKKRDNQDVIADTAVRNFGKMQGYGENLDAKDLTQTREFLKGFFEDINADQANFSGASAELKKLGKEIIEVGKNFDIANLSTEDAYKLFEKLLPLVQQYSDQALNDVIATEEEFGKKTNQNTENIKANRTATAELIREQEKMATSSQFAGQKIKELGDKVQATKIQTMSASQAMVNFASTLTGVWGSISSVTSAVKTLGDENATASQKIGGVVSSLTSVTYTGTQVAKTLKSLKTPLENAPKILTKLATKIGGVATTATAAGAASGGAGAAIAGTGAAATATTASVGTLAAGLGIFAVIAAVVVGTAIALYREYTKDARAAEQAAKKAKELADAYEELKTKTQEFNDTVNSYEEAKKGLEELTAGTEEYKQKVEEANEAAKKLLEEHPELKKNYKFEVGSGVIKIDPDALEKLKNTTDNNLKNALLEANEAQIKANNAQQKSLLTDLVRSNGLGNNDKEREAINQLYEIYNSNGQDYARALDSLKTKDDQLASVITNGFSDVNVKNYLDTIYGINNDNYQINKQSLSAIHNFNEDFNNQGFSDIKSQAILDAVINRRNEQAKAPEVERYTDVNRNLSLPDTFGKLLAGAALFNPSARPEDRGQSYQDFLDIQKLLKDYNLELTYEFVPGESYDDTPQTIFKLNGEEVFRTQLSGAAYRPYDEFYDNPDAVWDRAQKIFDKANEEKLSYDIQEETKKFETIIDSLKQQLSTTDSIAENLYASFQGGKAGDVSSLSLSTLKNENFAKDFGEKFWEDFGFKTAEDLTAYTQINVEQILKSYNDKVAKFYPEIQKILLDEWQNVAPEISLSIGTSLSNAFVQGGTKGFKNLNEILKNSKDPLQIISLLDSVDWRTADFDDLYNQLRSIGLEVDRKTFLNYANDLKMSANEAYNLTSTLSKLFEEFKNLKDIVDKLSFGSIISDEDYQKYIKDKEDFDGDFVWTTDGWMFIGDKDKISITNDNIVELRDQYAQARKDAALIYDEDLNKSNYQLATRYSDKEFLQSAASTTIYNGKTGITEEALNQAFDDIVNNKNIEEATKLIEAYGLAVRNLKLEEDKYADNNLLTAHIERQYKSVDELNKHWKELAKTWGEDVIEETAAQLVKIAAINEATAKGINTEDLVDYANYLKETNVQLERNEELLYQVATANLIAQKAYKDTVSTYESDIETLKNDNPLSESYRVSLERMRQNLADMLSISVEELGQIQADFFTNVDITKLYERIAQGDEEALQILTANAMIRAGQITETEKEVYLAFLQYVADNPGTATVKAFVELYGEGAQFLLGGNKSVAVDAAGLETDRKGNQATQGSIFDYNSYKSNLDKNKSSKSKTPKLLEDEIDRYHYIKKQLEDIERELERVNKAKERAYGAQHLKYLDQEIEYLREQAALQDKYVSEIESYLAKDRGLIAAYGAQFDQYGNISNYDQMFAANFAKYANAEDTTNWENFKKALSKYEETLDLWQEQTEEKAELLRQILDKQLEGIQYKIEIKLELDDRELALLEHQLNRLEDSAYDTAKAIANIGQQFEVNERKIVELTDAMTETLNTIPGISDEAIRRYLNGDAHALDGLTIEQGQLDMLKEYSDQLLELSDTLKQLHDDAIQRVKDAFDAWGEKIDDHVAKFEHLNNVIDNYQEIIGLLGQKNLGISNEFMREMRNQQITNLQGALDTRTQAKDSLTAQLAEARKRISEAATDAERKDWEELAEDIEKRLEDATEAWQEAWIAALQANKEAFEDTMQEIVDSFDDYEDELKRYDTAQDRYLETYRQAYELSKLTRDIQNSINDQDSIRAKQELQKLEDKINTLKKSGRKISEDELGLLQKEYELRLAEIALEDAQNAKSLVRLSRDNEGNWGYVYTADQDKIAEAQQNYEDKLYEYMRLSDEMADKSSRAILTLNKEMAEALAALDVNAEDYEAKVAEITEFYGQQIDYFAEQYSVAVDAMTNVARVSAEKYKPEVVDIIDSDNSGLQTNFNETVLAIIGDLDNLEDAVNTSMAGIRGAYDTTIGAFQNYQKQNEETCRLAGTNYENLADQLTNPETGYFSQIQKKAEEVKNSTGELAGEMTTYLGSVLDAFGGFSEKYSAKIDIINKANETLAQSIISLEGILQNLDGSSLKTLEKLADQVEAVAQKVREVGGSGGNDYNPLPPTSPQRYRIYSGFTRREYFNTDIKALIEEAVLDALEDEATSIEYSGWTRDDFLKYFSARVESLATGGYTGSWGTSGRLALLHEKELVLNQEDTENILDAVSLIRQITAGTASLATGLGSIGSGLNNIQLNNGSLDQNVNINASFPNVTNHFEIEEAFNNLVNKASQYAFRPATI